MHHMHCEYSGVSCYTHAVSMHYCTIKYCTKMQNLIFTSQSLLVIRKIIMIVTIYSNKFTKLIQKLSLIFNTQDTLTYNEVIDI